MYIENEIFKSKKFSVQENVLRETYIYIDKGDPSNTENFCNTRRIVNQVICFQQNKSSHLIDY